METRQEKLPTADERRALCGLIHEALVELRYLPEEQAHDLAYALHNLPLTMYGWGHWSVVGARQMLVHYQTKHSANLAYDYVTAFDAIFGESGDSKL